MAPLQDAPDYSQLASEVGTIELGVAQLLEELVNSIEKSKEPKEIEEKSKVLALEARRIALELKGADDMELNEHLVELENLEEKAQELLEHMPNSLMHAQQKKWANELETITSSTHKLKEGLNLLGMAHITGRQRKVAEMNMQRVLNSAKTKLASAQDAILYKRHAKAHPDFKKIERIQQAIKNAKEHVQAISKANAKKKFAGPAAKSATQIKRFISKELEGKVHIDWDTIRITSELTGSQAQWAHNEINAQALEMVFEGAGVQEFLANAKNKKSAIVGKFSCRPDAGGLMAEFDAIERKIDNGGISGRQFRARILV